MTGVPGEFSAYLYDGKTSERKVVTVRLAEPGHIVVQQFGTLARYQLSDITVAQRLAEQPVRIDLPDGVRLEVSAAAEFYAALKTVSEKNNGFMRWNLVGDGCYLPC